MRFGTVLAFLCQPNAKRAIACSPLEALTWPLIRPLPLRHSLPGALGFSIYGPGRILFSGFRKGDGHPDSIPFLLKLHGVLLGLLAYFYSISMPGNIFSHMYLNLL
jgi:hypothetical protein